MLKRIDEVCELKSGTSLPEEELSEVGYPYIKVSDMNIADNEKYIVTSKNFAKESINASMIFPKGTVVFPKRGGAIGTNKKRLCDCDICADLNVMGVIPNEEIMPLYLYYYFQKIDLGSLYNGSSVPQINNKDIGILQIDVPEKSEQEERIERLEKVDGIIRKRKSQLEWLDNLIKSRFVEMFGEVDLANTQTYWRAISTIGTVVSGATPKTNIDEYWNGEYRWITPAELDNASGYIYDSVRKLTEEGVKSCSLSELPVGTVILSSRAPIGKVAIAGNTFYCNQGFKNIICNDEVHPMFLYSLLRMNVEYLNSLGRGATFKEISKSIVENIKIPVPLFEQQEQFATFVHQVTKLKFLYRKSIKNTK